MLVLLLYIHSTMVLGERKGVRASTVVGEGVVVVEEELYLRSKTRKCVQSNEAKS